MPVTTQQIAAHVQGTLIGPGDLLIRGVESLDAAGPDQITFIRDSNHAGGWPASAAGAVLAGPSVQVEPSGRVVIRVSDADLAVAAALELFAPPPARPRPGVHPTAVVDPTARIGRDAAVGPGCYLGPGVRIGDGCVIHAHVIILDETTLGPGCELFPGAVVRDRCELGARVIMHPNSVVGSDGFNYRPAPDGSLVKIPHVGNVKIGDDVDIGACACVDRAKFSTTIVGNGTKIGNLCQVAHNCVIGRSCILAGKVGLAGSVKIGDGAMIGGSVSVKEHVHIGAGARVAATAVVMGDIPAGAVWGGYPAQDMKAALREVAAVRKLPDFFKSLRNQPRDAGKSGSDLAK